MATAKSAKNRGTKTASRKTTAAKTVGRSSKPGRWDTVTETLASGGANLILPRKNKGRSR